MNRVERPDWDTFYLTLANATALRGDCTRSQVGAVLVRQDHTVASIGYNGVAPGENGCLAGACPRGRLSYHEFPAGLPYDSGPGFCIARHAEWNALANMRPGDTARSCYVTKRPCANCQSALIAHGLQRIIWPDGQWSRS
jgi:dCMP deaminase